MSVPGPAAGLQPLQGHSLCCLMSSGELWWPGSRFLHVSVEGSIWTLLLHPDPKPKPDSAFFFFFLVE